MADPDLGRVPAVGDVVATTRATYDEIADAYARANADLPDSVLESMDRFVSRVPASGVVADVGCGPARDLAELRTRGLRVVGFDLSLGMLRAGGRSGVALVDMTAGLPVRPATLDGIWCAAAFLHVPRPQVGPTLAGFAQALKIGGVLHLSVAEGEGERMERDPYLNSGDRWFVHHEAQPLTTVLAKHGIRVLDVHRSQARRRWLTLDAIRE